MHRSHPTFAAVLLAAVFCFSAAEAATTTVRFCSDSTDNSTYTVNREASGWSFSSTGADGGNGAGTYTYPVRFNLGTRGTSAPISAGSYITELVLGVRVTQTARAFTVSPVREDSSLGTSQTIAPTSTSLESISFSFPLSDKIVSVVVSNPSGSGNAYLYYATVTTETPSGSGNTAPTASEPSVNVAATVGTTVELDLEDYFSDVDGDPLTYARESGSGSVSGSVWSFMPESEGSFSAEVSATDPSGDSATMTIEVTVSAAGLTPLNAPSIEPIHPEDSTEDGFVLRWMPVENAAAYELSVTNAADGTEASFEVSYSIPSGPDPDYVVATVSNLTSDTTYAVAVRALASTNPSLPSDTYADSDWSDAVTITTALEDGLQRAILMNEGFPGNAGTWNGQAILSSEGDLDASRTDFDTWHGNNLYNAPSALRFGNSSKHGWVVSPSISFSNDLPHAAVTVSFSSGALAPAATNRMVFSVLNASGETIEITGVSPQTLFIPALSLSGSSPSLSEALEAAGFQRQSFSFEAPAGFKIKFDASQGSANSNIAIDDVLVTQVYDPNFAALPAPTGVAESNVGKTGFTVAWNAVEHAEGYEVWLDGAFKASCAAADTSLALTGLSDGTPYSVQVLAKGDNLHYGDSPLSTEISVTTQEDVQKIDFTVTGAPTAPVFAGDTVSFTVTAESESTQASAPVSFSGIAAATFAAGAFSWTPTESDIGPHTATFTSGTYSTNVSIEVVSAWKTEPLKTEDFSEIKSSSWTSTSSYATEMDGDIGTWTGNSLVKTKSAVIVGRAGSSGTIVSPAVVLKVRTPGSLSVSFDTGSLPDKKASVQARILNAADGSVLYTTNFPTVAALSSTATAVSDAGARFTVSPGANVTLPESIQFSLETYESDGDDSYRAYIDTVVFAQLVSAKLHDLAAPMGLAVIGDPGENGFTVGWTAVDGATNYVVCVTDAAGEVAFSEPFCAATQIAVAGLVDGESYEVQVRATGDEALWFDSPWSDAITVRTVRSALHPTLSFGRWTNAVGDGGLYAGIANTAAVSAMLDDGETVVAVDCKGVSPVPAVGPTFSNGTLSWRPDDADTNQTFSILFEMTPAGGSVYTTNIFCTVLAVPPLEDPAITVVSTGIKKASFSWDPEPQFRATGYLVRLWRGSEDYTRPGVCCESFFDNVIPHDWFATGTPGTGWYKDVKTPVKFEKTGDSLISKLHSAPVTRISFETKGYSVGEIPSEWTLYASTGGTNEMDWVTVTSESVSTSSSYRNFLSESNYRRFKWVFTKKSGNLGLGSIEAEHEGAGAKFVNGYGSAAAAQPVGMSKTHSCDTLRANTEYFLEVTVTDGSATASSVVRFHTPPAPKATIMVFR